MSPSTQTVAIIPARLQSTRLPEKLLQDLQGKPLLQRVIENVKSFDFFSDVCVVTDSAKIFSLCEDIQCRVIMSKDNHESGTSRIAEIVKDISAEIVVNIQGDEPFIKKSQVASLVSVLIKSPESSIATLIIQSEDEQSSTDPNIVKVVKNKDQHALYFSRLPIPFFRDSSSNKSWYHHIGVYAYRRAFLEAYPFLVPCSLESSEKLEQLRFLSNGYKILLVETDEKTVGIDTLEDLERARKFLADS